MQICFQSTFQSNYAEGLHFSAFILIINKFVQLNVGRNDKKNLFQFINKLESEELASISYNIHFYT